MAPIVAAVPPPTLTPPAAVQPVVSASADWGSYTVKSGDSLHLIAQRHNTTVAALLQRNNLPNGGRLIHPGQRLLVPSTASTPAAPAKPAAPTTTTYRVAAGDTLIGIAKRHRTTARAIAALNKISVSSTIRVGQTLKVPTNGAAAAKATARSAPAPATTTTYTVVAGDTLIGIANRHRTTARAIAALNKISVSSTIRVGQRLTLPGAGTAPAATKAAAPSPAPATTTTYRVAAGDTLIGIANRHRTTARAIAALNKISVSSTIRVGQTLKVPTNGAAAAKAASSSASASKQPELSTPFNAGGYSERHFPTTTVAAAKKNHEVLASRPVPSREQAKAMIIETAKRHGVDPALALAIGYQESGWNHRNVSVANAIGIMQVIPASGDWAGQMLGRELNLLDPRDNVTAGVAILRAHLRTAADEETAIAAYYQGMASVRKNGMYDDTRAYVRTVQALRATFR